MNFALIFIFVIILIALLFDFTNGMHDAANSVSTVVSTRVLSPRQAVVWAAFFNFAAFAVLGTRGAKTIGGDMIHIELVPIEMRLFVLLAGILGAILWNLLTWYLGLPTSSSHALIGGYAGAAIAAHRGLAGLLEPRLPDSRPANDHGNNPASNTGM
jgi:PiT family inorganic phosphate transporter